jgi:hypothetical protein
MNTDQLTEAKFDSLTREGKAWVILSTRGKLAVREHLMKVFENRIPQEATDYYVDSDTGVFLSWQSPAWYQPVAVLPINQSQRLQLKLLGLYGPWGWDI